MGLTALVHNLESLALQKQELGLISKSSSWQQMQLTPIGQLPSPPLHQALRHPHLRRPPLPRPQSQQECVAGKIARHWRLVCPAMLAALVKTAARRAVEFGAQAHLS